MGGAAVRLRPDPRERVWGRNGIGEIWYLSDQKLPLLVKFISTSDRLSVQVHPDDGEGVACGKSEMWHILEAEPGATIAMGFREPVTRGQLREAALSGEIERLVRWVEVKAGETYYIPAHTVHAIGAGIVLCEIQQNSDTTYRLYDYGRPRELHLEQALAVADTGEHPGASRPKPLGPGRDELVRCPHFVTELLRLSAGTTHTHGPQQSQLFICLEGEGEIGGRPFAPREVWWIDDQGTPPSLHTEQGASFLRTYVP
jgi:mannose-6-phosphate isomerase